MTTDATTTNRLSLTTKIMLGMAVLSVLLHVRSTALPTSEAPQPVLKRLEMGRLGGVGIPACRQVIWGRKPLSAWRYKA